MADDGKTRIRDTLFRQVEMSPLMLQNPQIGMAMIEDVKTAVAAACVEMEGLEAVGPMRIKVTVEQDVWRELDVVTVPAFNWRDGCHCYGGPHGGYTCDRCAGRRL